MNRKKINAVLGLVSILLMLLHMGYTVYAYVTFTYNPALKLAFAIPFMVVVCLHAFLGMWILFTQADGTRMDLYPKQNRGTVLQRVSAALMLPLLFLHINTFSLMEASARKGWFLFVVLLMFSELLFFGVVITHVVISLTKGLITLGFLSSREKQKTLDWILYVLGAVAFGACSYVVLKGQILLFFMA